MTGKLDRPMPTGTPTAESVEQLPEVLTGQQAAWLLQLTTGRLSAAAARGEVPSRKIGRQRLYSKSALLALITDG
ncbi:MAG: helix-turn-helix domain-containing protein [Actinomycetota bacterium]|nr:helix-turn-helix domain-containing protein [Actinomycetota bacterium]